MNLTALKSGYLLEEYQIIELIGEGGFGLTYLALDKNLDKKVAIKEYFPQDFAIRNGADQVLVKSESLKKEYQWGRDSFIKEAKILAQFDDNNIVKIYRYFEANGSAYIVMEFCESGSLEQLLKDKDTLGEEEVKEILKPVCLGLKKVHEKGVLHRDIKPENIMFRKDGSPVLIDFGASRYALGQKTKEFTTIFTPGYAPIEQYGNSTELGPWTDIYSLAAVAYRCLLGRSPQNVMDRIHDDQIIKLEETKSTSMFFKSIDNALSLSADDRPRSLHSWLISWGEGTVNNQSEHKNIDNTQVNYSVKKEEQKQYNKVFFVIPIFLILLGLGFLANNYFSKKALESQELVSIENQDSTSQINSIAILPFKSLSHEQGNDFFVNGVHDSLTTQLAKIQSLKVISQGSMMKYSNTEKSLSEIGEELNVKNILSGSVQRSGERLRINVQLHQTDQNQLIWAETYDEELNTNNIFDIQSQISIAITNNLKATLTDTIRDQLVEKPTNNLKAYDFYLRGKQIGFDASLAEILEAIDYYKQAVKIDPTFKQAWIGLASKYIDYYWHSQGSKDNIRNAFEAINKAKEIDNDFVELNFINAYYYYYGELNFTKALIELDKVIQRDSNNSDAHLLKGLVARRAGLWNQAVDSLQKSLILGPLDYFNWLTLAETYMILGDYPKAYESIDKAKKLVGNNVIVKYFEASVILDDTGDIKRVIDIIYGTQHMNNRIVKSNFIDYQILNGTYDEAISVAETFTPKMEVWRQKITLKEDMLSRLYLFKKDKNKAKYYAKIAIDKLDKLKQELGEDDYRINLPYARMYAVLRDEAKTEYYISKAKDLAPNDAFENLYLDYESARAYGLLGHKDKVVSMLDNIKKPLSYYSKNVAELDPHFKISIEVN